MIALLDNGQDLDTCAVELGCEVGQLLTPLTRYTLRDPGRPWAIDNGAFAGFDARAFLSLLEREKHHRENCLFVTVPDVVGAARRMTLGRWERGETLPSLQALHDWCQALEVSVPLVEH